MQKLAVRIPVNGAAIEGDLALPPDARGIVVFAHGSGSSRRSPRNRQVARAINAGGFGTLLLDLLTAAEDEVDRRSRALRFDVQLLARRLVHATRWLARQPGTASLSLGCFGASTGAAAALLAAAHDREHIRAVVSRGGRPDLAGDALSLVRAPTLLIVGGRDKDVLELNRQALDLMLGERRLEVVPGATHLFEEPGALERVAELARDWFEGRLDGAGG